MLSRLKAGLAVVLLCGAILAGAQSAAATQVISLDSQAGWKIATDPDNVGKTGRWFTAPRADARPTPVPWVIQEIFDDYHGVVWYWREFDCPNNPDSDGRYLLRFAHVDYLGEVWVNDRLIGSHEGADGVFTLDATDAIKPGGKNRLAIRVLNPKDEPIDGISLAETPHRNKTCQFTFGCDYNHGGLEGSVELLVVPALRIDDLYVKPDPATGAVVVRVTVHNAHAAATPASLTLEVAPARDGATTHEVTLSEELPVGSSVVTAELKVASPHRWNLDDPYLYRVSAALAPAPGQRLSDAPAPSTDKLSTRCGFRDFRISDGWFHLNGRRIFVRSSHTGNMAPIGMHLPYEKGWFRQDLLYTRALGFNMIRFIAGYPTPEQLELCDELGMLAYDEPYSAWLLADSPNAGERFDRSVAEMVLRDRNHPSVVIWGLLNETLDRPISRHALGSLGKLRDLDEDRVVLYSSGRFDLQQETTGSAANPGSRKWQTLLGGDGQEPAEKLAMLYPSPKNAGDAHLYPQVPHTREAIDLLRTYGADGRPFFLSEYGIASGVDLLRVVRQYEQRGKGASGEARFHADALARFQADWDRWHMADVFGRPEEFFTQSLARMGPERLRGINALRANPKCNGYSLTGTVDQGYSGEGLTSPFRELKPGTSDALADGLTPLRLCTFVEPINAYRGQPICIEVVLSNEDVLQAGAYPLRVDVLDEESRVVWSKRVELTIPPWFGGGPAPMVVPAFDESPAADWPAGRYRVAATFEKNAAAAGGTAEFNVVDAAEMPAVGTEIVLWGDDAELRTWLKEQNIALREFADAPAEGKPQIILASGRATGDDKPASFKQLLATIESGSKAVFLTPQRLAEDGLALPCGGEITGLWSVVYHKEEWNRRHPAFGGMSSGGLMDYTDYRDLIPNIAWMRAGEAPAEPIAGAIHPAPGGGYASGLLLFTDKHGQGDYTVNLFRVRELLGVDPQAERLLRNLLNVAAKR